MEQTAQRRAMKQQNQGWIRLVLFFSLFTPLIVSLVIIILMQHTRAEVSETPPSSKSTSSEYVYVYVTPPSEETTEEETSSCWIVREHEGRIAVFNEDGTALAHWDVYVKALPKADQILLREGITVTSRQELYALMEDYGA